MNCLLHFATPQLETIHKGKVRDSIRVNDASRLLVVTDRLSAFDNVLQTPIPYKGAVLNGIANWWFEQTKDIIDNHLIKQVDPNITLVKEVQPLRVEMIVRGYLTGSMWRGYQKGKRTFSGASVGDGLTKNQRFPQPLLTPTTKEKNDRPITPAEIVETGLVAADVYKKMEEVALALFQRGTEYLAEKGIVLVDTKYEFGLLDGELILIDEIHTPDSSRFWSKKDYEANPEKAAQIDKEFVRQWLIANKKDGAYPTTLPEDIVAETTKRYQQIYEVITGQPLALHANEHIKTRMTRNLVGEGLIKDGYVAIVMGSASDLPHCEKIKGYLDKYGVKAQMRVLSAHKNGERLVKLAHTINNSVEPIVVIAVAGRSNGLGGALAANVNVPVINCPPYKDKVDMMVNVNSSLVMPSKTPATTAVHVDNAAYAALRSLNIPRIRSMFSQDIADLKAGLLAADEKISVL